VRLWCGENSATFPFIFNMTSQVHLYGQVLLANKGAIIVAYSASLFSSTPKSVRVFPCFGGSRGMHLYTGRQPYSEELFHRVWLVCSRVQPSGPGLPGSRGGPA